MSSSVVLFSGGMDSTVALWWAKSWCKRVTALSVFYGQPHSSELEAATKIAQMAGVDHEIIAMPSLAGPIEFIPGRNAILLSLAVNVAVRALTRNIVAGFCQADAADFPDCRGEFIGAMQRSLALGLRQGEGSVSIHAPLLYWSKPDTIRFAQTLGCMDAIALSVTCYRGKRPGCGECKSCLVRSLGFADAGLPDPGVA